MNILDTIAEHKREEVASRKRSVKVSDLRDMEFFSRTPHDLRESLCSAPVFGIIAEIKRSSPSAGLLRKNVNPSQLAQEYVEHGASGISVLTDEQFFGGSLHDLETVRRSVTAPLLRKDFIIDPFQIAEAKSYGADAVLLIAAILEKSQLRELFDAARELRLHCLVELYEEQEIDILDFDTMKFVGINNRDLRTFRVDIDHTLQLSRHIPKDVTLVSESGMTTSDDLVRLRDNNIKAALIGEHFMKSDSPGKALAQLLYGVKNGRES
jgi:indole-3-glycerol phosphate synthase